MTININNEYNKTAGPGLWGYLIRLDTRSDDIVEPQTFSIHGDFFFPKAMSARKSFFFVSHKNPQMTHFDS